MGILNLVTHISCWFTFSQNEATQSKTNHSYLETQQHFSTKQPMNEHELQKSYFKSVCSSNRKSKQILHFFLKKKQCLFEPSFVYILFVALFPSCCPFMLLACINIACHLSGLLPSPPRWSTTISMWRRNCAALLCQQNLWMTRERQQSGNKTHDASPTFVFLSFALPPSLALSSSPLPCSLFLCIALS